MSLPILTRIKNFFTGDKTVNVKNGAFVLEYFPFVKSNDIYDSKTNTLDIYGLCSELDSHLRVYSDLEYYRKNYEHYLHRCCELESVYGWDNISISELYTLRRENDIIQKELESIHENYQKKLSEKNDLILELQSRESYVGFKDNRKFSRNNKAILKWREKVKQRDNYTCQCCGSTNAPEAHHIFSFDTYNSRAAELDNGITLCKDCHCKYHKIYGYGGKNNNAVTMAKFMGEYGKSMSHTSIIDEWIFDEQFKSIMEKRGVI